MPFVIGAPYFETEDRSTAEPEVRCDRTDVPLDLAKDAYYALRALRELEKRLPPP